MSFNSWWINMVMGSVSTVQFSVLMNGQPGKRFKPFRRLRHGDPISLYLLLVITDVLSRLIHDVVHNRFLEGIRLSMHRLTISHLLFADDTLIFLRDFLINCYILNAYCTTSGQEVSMQKIFNFLWGKCYRRVAK